MKPAIASSIEQIRDLLGKVGGMLAKAAEIYVKELSSDPSFRQTMIGEFPGMTASFLSDLEAVGRGLIEPRILEMGLSCGSRLKRLPLSQQRQLIEKGVEVWTGDDSRVIPLADCGPRVLMQCIAKDHIRSVSEQAAWHEEENAKRRADAAATQKTELSDGNALSYRVDRAKKRVKILYPPCTLTAKELRRLLDELI